MATDPPASSPFEEVPGSARVAVLAGFGTPLEIRTVPMPKTVEPGALLVRIECATMCGTDVHLWQGSLWPDLDLAMGYVLGHECVGSIVAFGEGAEVDSFGSRLEVGDRVIWTNESCGHCVYCGALDEPGLCRDRRGQMTMPSTTFPYLTGAFADYGYVLPRSGRVRVPDQVSSTRASAASCSLRTVMHAFERLGRIAPTDTVVVQGAGPIGLYSVVMARMAGAKQVVVIGADDRRLHIARAWGADAIITLDQPPAVRADVVRELTEGRGADVVVEASGVAEAFAEGVTITRPGARYVLTGIVGEEPTMVTPGLLVSKQLTVLGTWSASISHYRDALQFLCTVGDQIDLDLMFAEEYTLETVSDALLEMAGGRAIKPVVRPRTAA